MQISSTGGHYRLPWKRGCVPCHLYHLRWDTVVTPYVPPGSAHLPPAVPLPPPPRLPPLRSDKLPLTCDCLPPAAARRCHRVPCGLPACSAAVPHCAHLGCWNACVPIMPLPGWYTTAVPVQTCLGRWVPELPLRMDTVKITCDGCRGTVLELTCLHTVSCLFAGTPHLHTVRDCLPPPPLPLPGYRYACRLPFYRFCRTLQCVLGLPPPFVTWTCRLDCHTSAPPAAVTCVYRRHHWVHAPPWVQDLFTYHHGRCWTTATAIPVSPQIYHNPQPNRVWVHRLL